MAAQDLSTIFAISGGSKIISMGKTCKLKDVSFQCMTKFTTKKKKNKEKKIKLFQ